MKMYKVRFITLFTFLVILLKTGNAQISLTATSGTLSGTYTTIKGAFDKINDGTHKGDITIQITANTTEGSAAVLNASGSGSASFTSVLIYPASSGLSVSGTLASPIIDLNGADNVTIDGRVNQTGNKDLVIANSNTGTGNTTSTIRLYNDANNNTVRYCTIKGSQTGSSSGMVFLSTAGSAGNTGDRFEYCDFTRNTAGIPKYLLFSNGTSAKENIAIISNNNFYDFSDIAVYVAGYSKTWTISDNSIYQTATITSTSTNAAMQVSSGGDGFSIYNNYIGGSAPNCGGTAWTSNSAGSYGVYGIYVSVGTTVTSNVYSNTITNFSLTTVNSSTPFTGIYSYSGNANIGTNGANIIGSGTGTGSITVNSNYSGGIPVSYGIWNANTGTKDVSNNIIGSITIGNTSTSSGSGHRFYGIAVSNGTNTISNNLIGSTTTANSINLTNSQSAGASSSGQDFYGIYCSVSGSATVSSNIIANINNSWLVSSSSYGNNYGIYASPSGSSPAYMTISSNTIYTISSAQPQTAQANIYGIYLTASSSNIITINGNQIYDLRNTSASTASKVCGIYFSGTASYNKVEKNLIHSLYTASNTSVQYGIYNSNGYASYRNNLIRLGYDKSGTPLTNTVQLIGVQTAASSSSNRSAFQNNTIYIGGTGVSAGSVKTYGFYKSNSAYDTIRNNIIVNVRQNAAANKQHYATYYNNIPQVSDYNVYYYSATDGQIDNSYATLQTFRVYQVNYANDLHSCIGDPKLVNPTGDASALNMNISLVSGSTPVEGTGLVLADVTDDYSGQTRSSYTPADIGAYAGNFTAQTSADETFTPYIGYTTFSYGGSTSVTLTSFATITDQISGVNTSDGTKPRLYYKKSSDANAFAGNTSANNGWKWVEATNTSSPFSFVIDHSILYGGVPTSGTIYYYVVAQDLANTPNVMFWPLAGSIGTSVATTGMTAPTTTSSYSILSAPTANAADQKSSSGFRANWSSVTGATGYYLDVATDNGFTSYVSGYNNLNVGNVTNSTLTGLTANTSYYYRIRAYNTLGTSANSSTITAITYATAPTVQASSLTFNNYTSNGFTINYTRGNGDYCVLFAKASGTGSPAPVTGTTYTANATYGSGTQIGSTGWYCIYRGTASSAPITGLTAGTTYRIKVVEFNGVSTAECYLSDDATGNPADQSVNNSAMSGNYTISSSGADFSTITSAVSALSSRGVSGSVNLILQDASYTSETLPITLANVTGISATNNITIKPANGVSSTISGSTTNAIFNFTGTYYTIDGLNANGSTLTMLNTNTSGNIIKFAGASSSNYCSNNTLTNCTILGENTSSSCYYVYFQAYTRNCTLSNNVIRANSTNYSPILVYSYGNSTSYKNTGLTITGNYLADYGNTSASSHAAISLGYVTSDCNVSNNRIYQTTTRYFTLTSGSTAYNYYYGIYVRDGSGHTVNGNTIGFSNSAGTGVTSLDFSGTGSTTYNYIYPIYFTTNTTTASTINSNLISGFSLAGGTRPVNAGMIYVEGTYEGGSGTDNNTRTVTVSGNTIGSTTSPNVIQLTSTGSISFRAVEFGDPGSGLQYIYTATIQNNTVGGINTGGTTPSSAYFSLILLGGKSGAVFNASGNTLGYQAAPIVLGNTSTGNTLSFSAFEIYYLGYGVYNLSGNNAGYITSYGTAGACYGVYADLYNPTSTYNFSGNTFHDMTSGCKLYGIYTEYTPNRCTYSANTIYNLSSGAACYGMQYGDYNSTIERNYIYRLKTTNAASAIYGMYMNGQSYGSTANTVKNNVIVLGQDVDGSSLPNYLFYAIYDYNNGGQSSFYFNTCVILGTGTSGTQNSYAFYKSSSGYSATIIKNNICANLRSNSGGTGSHYAIRMANTTNTTINFNDYYVSGTGGMLGNFSNSDKSTLALWKSATGQETNSLNTDPAFNSPGNVCVYYYMTGIILQGTAISGITTDYSGATRNAVPNMGAMEGFVWKGTTSTDFADASNWLNGNVPFCGGCVVFDPAPSNHCILDQNRTVYGVINSQSTYKLDLNGYKLTVTGDIILSNGAQIKADVTNSEIVFSGTSAQTISGATFENNTLYNLTLNNSNGVTNNSDITVSNILTLTSGKLILGTGNLTIGANASIAGSLSSSNMIVPVSTGELRKVFTGTGSFVYPLGDTVGTDEYSPATLEFTSGTFSSAYAGIRVTNTKHGSNGSVTDYINRYWSVSQNGISDFSCNVTMQYLPADVVGTEGNVWTGKYSGGTWTLLSQADAVNHRISGTVSGFSEFTGGQQGILPVRLESFTSSVNGRDVSLRWITSWESNNTGFDIERKKENADWEKIGFSAGKGNSSVSSSYKFDDIKLTSGKYHYRLKQIDNNGGFEYHELNNTVEVGIPTKYDMSQNYPNPFNPSTKIDFQLPADTKVTIAVYDLTGREMKRILNNENKKADYYTVEFNASSFASGVYFYRIVTEKFTLTKKMVLVK